jgi:hypothetical protein
MVGWYFIHIAQGKRAVAWADNLHLAAADEPLQQVLEWNL